MLLIVPAGRILELSVSICWILKQRLNSIFSHIEVCPSDSDNRTSEVCPVSVAGEDMITVVSRGNQVSTESDWDVVTLTMPGFYSTLVCIQGAPL